MMCAAMRTRPAAGCQAQFLELVTAGGTRLRGWVEGANLCKDPAFMLRLVFSLAQAIIVYETSKTLCFEPNSQKNKSSLLTQAFITSWRMSKARHVESHKVAIRQTDHVEKIG